MANKEHLAILKQGGAVWDGWRDANRAIQPDLSHANLSHADLSYADLGAADLSHADLNHATLIEATLSDADLGSATLIEATLSYADLSYANLTRADLSGANLIEADLSGANLTDATLRGANLIEADLTDATLSNAILGNTTLAALDLSQVRGLESVKHAGPSSIGIDTIYWSRGQIPEVFLRGAGVPDQFIEYMHSLLGKAIEYYSCFISYSSQDEDFARRLYEGLQANNVRCWFAPEDLPWGEKIRPGIDWAIRKHEKLLLILSESSVASDWVEQEVETAFERERQEKKLVLFPVRLDEAVMKIENGWPAHLRHTRNIGDFSGWKDHDPYQKAFERLLRDLNAATEKEA